MLKIGDQVKFLSETGGGRVAGFKGNNVVLVEDNDGFQIPVALSDVVACSQNDDYSTSNVVRASLGDTKSNSTEAKVPGSEKHGQKAQNDKRTIEEENKAHSEPVEERRGGDVLSCYLAFVPLDVSAITDTRYECYFVNDSNYYIQYTFLTAEGNNWTLYGTGEVAPNTKEFIKELGSEDLQYIEHSAIQLIAYKRDKYFVLKPVADVQIRIDPVKFYKRHTFVENDFFEQPALLFAIIKDDKVRTPLNIDAKKLKQEMYASSKEKSESSSYVHRYDNGKHNDNLFVIKRKGDEDVVVIDLHINELLETTAGMSATDILNYQLSVFRKTLDEYKSKKGQQIVFIHGKGEGVLRRAVVQELGYHYKAYTYQDASFQEYGYGATLVTIK